MTASDDKTVRIWNDTWKETAILSGNEEFVTSSEFSPDGQRAAIVGGKVVKIWNINSKEQVATLAGHQDVVRSVSFSADGQQIVTGSDDKTARIWSSQTHQTTAVLIGHTKQVWAAQFSPDGRHVVTASDDRTARIWDAHDGRLITTLEGHSESVLDAEYSPDANQIVTASFDKTARIWNAETGNAIAILEGHQDAVQSAGFSPDGKSIVTSSWDMTVRIWPLISVKQWTNTEALVSDAKRATPRCLSVDQRVNAFLNIEPPVWCIEMHKWPYDTEEWQEWNKYTSKKLAPPLPTTSKWRSWIKAHQNGQGPDKLKDDEIGTAARSYDCQSEIGMHSTFSDHKTNISFHNYSSEIAVVYWLDKNGNRQLWKILAPDETFNQQTFATYPFVVADQHGACRGIYVSPDGSTRVDVALGAPQRR
jgi:WD40 repeat protein